MKRSALAFAALLCAAPVHAQTAAHRVHRPAAPAAAKTAQESTPALPPGVPPAAGEVKTAFALRYIDTVVGTGDPVAPNEFLTVQYTGWLASIGTKFDSSLDRPEPFTFMQGAHRVIPGWDQGFGGMRVGGKRRLFIPYQLAYGDRGQPPVIPPASDLIFDIELVSASANPPGEPPAPPAPPQPATPPSR